MRYAIFALLSLTLAVPAAAETCSERPTICQSACTPELVASGAQAGGTVPGCRMSCQTRLRQCLHSGISVHMGSARRGDQQTVEKL